MNTEYYLMIRTSRHHWFIPITQRIAYFADLTKFINTHTFIETENHAVTLITNGPWRIDEQAENAYKAFKRKMNIK